jgi:hypothetical protein
MVHATGDGVAKFCRNFGIQCPASEVGSGEWVDFFYFKCLFFSNSSALEAGFVVL